MGAPIWRRKGGVVVRLTGGGEGCNGSRRHNRKHTSTRLAYLATFKSLRNEQSLIGEGKADPLITRNHTQEGLSIAYVHAVAAAAGALMKSRDWVDYGFDGEFRRVVIIGKDRIPSGPPVDFQLKATINWLDEGDHVGYDLSARTQRILAHRGVGSPFSVLILLCLPKEENKWLASGANCLVMRHCCYWLRIIDPPTDNQTSIRVRIPKSNLFNADAVGRLIDMAVQEVVS